ncbi:MAG: hypothetical protein ABH983_01640 [Candidatus Micrarchaeota archaeon]
MKKTSLLIVLFLLLVTPVFSDAVTTSWQANWLPLSFLAVMLSVSIVGFIYIFAHAFEARNAKIWAKEELYQAFANILLITILFTSVAGINQTVMPGLASLLDRSDLSEAENVQIAAHNYIDTVVGEIRCPR